MSSYKSLLRNLFSAQIKEFRNAKKLTQEEMSERLHITSRAYSDLERGCSCCSAIALLFFLLMLESDELSDFLNKIRKRSRFRIKRRLRKEYNLQSACPIHMGSKLDEGKFFNETSQNSVIS